MIVSSFKKLLSDNIEVEEQTPQARWSLLKVTANQVYKHNKLFALSANTLYHETHGKLSIKDSDNDDHKIHMFKELAKFREKALKRIHQFVHIGYIAVGIIPLFCKGLNASCIGALLDTRHKSLNDQTISILQGSLSNGTIYIECFPNFSCSLSDGYFNEVVSLLIKTNGLDMKNTFDHLQIAYRMIVRMINTCVPSVYNSGYLQGSKSSKGQNIVMKVDDTTMGTLPKMVEWQEVQFPTEWKLNISKTLMNEVQHSEPMKIERLGSTNQYKVLGKSKSKRKLASVLAPSQYNTASSSSAVSSSKACPKLMCIHPETYKDFEGLFRCKL
ncbi:hypothetical protein GOP47_0024414 [Adiantum capillus-veneris]|uniref:Uncharacterized protein n=1 Tax=Adiantum capillus-veneris TaxID=13818 RepID=A0A9D4Z3N6_ADICA|nr:hypothetical protein GOP47_0024414 [Adiantum capillus-veneris]